MGFESPSGRGFPEIVMSEQRAAGCRGVSVVKAGRKGHM